MKSKITWPVVLAFIVLCLVISGEILLLFNDITVAVRTDTWSDYSYHYVLYRILFEIIATGIILYIVISKNVKKISGPIEELTKDAKNFKSDSYIYPIRDYEIEEVQDLASAFDYMGDELGSTIRKLKHQKEKLEIMLEALEEGIIVLNKEGFIGQANELAKKMLHLKGDLKGKQKLTHIIRNEEFKKLVDEGLKKGGHHTVELTLDEQIVFLSLLPIGKQEEAYEYLLVIRDVTQLRKLEEMRSQFVSNVSHELKTPLTSIQGFVETLQGGAVENPKVAYKFLNIIDIETKRLYRLIQDILILSEIESMEEQQYGEMNITDAVDEIFTLVHKEAETKSIELIYEPRNELKVKNISEDHMKQLLMNLISNAIKYTDHGEIKVIVEKNHISVQDTGIGIPEESISRIFERFYRVDKSRSRQSGGTGLGLSIVKHIAQLYGIIISVESEVGKGSKFTLSIDEANIV